MEKRPTNAGSGILEIMLSLGLLAISLSGLYALYGQSTMVLRSSNNAAIVQTQLLARIDQLRGNGWATNADRTRLALFLTQNPVLTTNGNIGMIETFRVSPRAVPPAATLSTTPYFTIIGSGQSFSVSQTSATPEAALDEPQLNFTLIISWSEKGRTLTREHSTILSKLGSR